MDTAIEKGHSPEIANAPKLRVLLAESRFNTKVMQDVFKLFPDVSVTPLESGQTVIGELARAKGEGRAFDMAFIARTLGSQNGEEIVQEIQKANKKANKGDNLVDSVFLTVSANNTRTYSPEDQERMGLTGVIETDEKGLGKIPRLITAYKNVHSQQQK